MLSYITKVAMDVKQNHALPYGFLMTKLIAKLGAKFNALEYYSTYDALYYFDTRRPHTAGGLGDAAGGSSSSQSQET